MNLKITKDEKIQEQNKIVESFKKKNVASN